jgi:hypothetical protein
MFFSIELFESPDVTPLDFCLWLLIKSEVYKRKVDTRDELLARILDAATRIKAKNNSDVQQAIWGTRIEKCMEDGGRIFEHLW